MLKPHQVGPYTGAVFNLERALVEIENISMAGLNAEDRHEIEKLCKATQQLRAHMFSMVHETRVEGIR